MKGKSENLVTEQEESIKASETTFLRTQAAPVFNIALRVENLKNCKETCQFSLKGEQVNKYFILLVSNPRSHMLPFEF